MMRHARRAALLVAFFLLITAATAYAECAWVLWNQGVMRLEGEVEWRVETAVTTQDQCRSASPPGR